MVVALLGLLGAGVPPASAERFEETRIPHLDGSGRATIVEIDPRVPGADAFLRATPERVPEPGELITPSRASATPTPPRAAPLPSPSPSAGHR
jgi:hypothetical protein